MKGRRHPLHTTLWRWPLTAAVVGVALWFALAGGASAQERLPQVTGLVATPASDTEITLRWDLAPRAGGYLVEWGVATGVYTGSATTTALSHAVSGLAPETRYYFRVTATGTIAADGLPSGEESATTNPAPQPEQVMGVSATAISDRELQVEWQAARHATGYVVQWDTDVAFPAPEQATVGGTAAIVEDLKSETEYFVRVYGTRNGAADGAASAADSATTDQAPLKTWGERFPGGPVAAQLGLAAFGGVMAGFRFRGHKSPQREAEIVGVMCLASLILPVIGIGNIFWTGGIVLLIGVASVAVIFLSSRR